MIQILLATYNGKEYIKEQLDSILNQTYQNFEILIRDDKSSDNTLEIIKEISDSRIKVLPSDKNLGIKQNFGELLKASSAEYIMFCDQDDIWLPNKIEVTLSKMKQMESENDKSTPILIYTDLIVVDKHLNIIDKSFWHYQNVNPNYQTLNKLLIHNPVTGCTMMINKALKDKTDYIPSESIMHDWWIALITSCFGILDYLPETTIFYRQHGKNDVGAKKSSLLNLVKTYSSKKNIEKYINLNKKRLIQAKLLHDLYKNNLDIEQLKTINEFLSLEKSNSIKKILISIKNNFMPSGKFRKVLHLLSLIPTTTKEKKND